MISSHDAGGPIQSACVLPLRTALCMRMEEAVDKRLQEVLALATSLPSLFGCFELSSRFNDWNQSP